MTVQELDPDAAQRLAAAFWRGLRPDPLLTVAEWAARYRVLSRSTSGQPGPWRNELTPYLVEIMEALSPSSAVETVVFVAGSQIGKTEVLLNFLGFIAHQAPGPTIFVLPTEGVAENFSKERLTPLFTESEVLRDIVRDPKKRDSGNTLLRKEFPGGSLKLVSADSPAQLASTPARYAVGDEVDRWAPNPEGDQTELAKRGQIAFRRRKSYWTSTPTLEGESKIWNLLEATDVRYFLVPCPHCGHAQRLVWDQLKYDGEKRGAALRESIHYMCASCEQPIQERHKPEMLSRGRWEASKESENDKTRGYHINTLYSPWFGWDELVQKWIEAQKSVERLKTFVNIFLGECWAEKGEKPDWKRLYERREAWPAGMAPHGVTFLTAAVDVQGDRLEYEVAGWGANRERWGIEYGVLEGDPSQDTVWRELWTRLDREWPHESGVPMRLKRIAVDSGFLATEVYKQCAPKKRPRTTIIVKGRDEQQVAIMPPTATVAKTRAGRAKASVYMVGSSLLKLEIYHALRQDRPVEGEEMPAGYHHFPDSYPPEFFRQLTAEELRTRRNKRGFSVREWVKTGERNEALDLAVYNRAAAADVGLDRWTPEQWAAERRAAGLPDLTSAAQPPAKPRKARPVRSGPSRFERWRNRR